VLTADQLRRATGYDQDAAVIKWLKRNGIPFHYGKDSRPVTTIQAVNRSLLAANESDDITFDRGPKAQTG